MAALPNPSTLALAFVTGTMDAQALVRRMRSGVTSPGALLKDLLEVQATGDAERVAGFVRELEKVLERTP